MSNIIKKAREIAVSSERSVLVAKCEHNGKVSIFSGRTKLPSFWVEVCRINPDGRVAVNRAPYSNQLELVLN